MRIIAFITDGPAVRDILDHLGESTAPPRIAPARLPARGHLGARAHPKVPPPACGAARCRRKSTPDPPRRRLHTHRWTPPFVKRSFDDGEKVKLAAIDPDFA